MISTGYAFTSAYLKGEEARLIAPEHVDQMSNAPTIQGVLEIIKDTDVGSYLSDFALISFGDIDQYLWDYFRYCLERLEWFKMVPNDLLKLLRAYTAKYDVLNIKAALWRVTSSRKARMIPVGTLHSCGLLDRLANAENLDDIIESLIRCKLRNYADILREEEQRLHRGARSSLLVDARLDNEYYRNMLNIAGASTESPMFSKSLGIIIDLTNLQIILRAIIEDLGPEVAEYTIDGGHMLTSEIFGELLSVKLSDMLQKLDDVQYRDVAQEILAGYDGTKSIAAVVETVEAHKFRLLKEILAPKVLSPLMMVYYLVLKEAEIRNMRLILKAMLDGIPLVETRKYLVLAS